MGKKIPPYSLVLNFTSGQRAKLDLIAKHNNLSPEETLLKVIDDCEPEDFEVLFVDQSLADLAKKRVAEALNDIKKLKE